MDEQTREQKTTDALIARGFADPHAVGDCPEPGVLAAFHERTLEADETQRWLGHVADCRRCQALLAALGRTEPADGVDPKTDGSTASPWWRWRVLAPLAAVSIVVLAVWVVDPGGMRNRRVAVEDRQEPTPSLPEQAAAAMESAEARRVPPTTGAPAAAPESSTAAVTRTGATPVREVAAVPRAQAAAATPTASAPLAPSAAAASAPPPGPTRSAVNQPDALGLVRRTAVASDAAPPLESARFAAVAAPDALLIVSPDPATRWRVVPSGAVERSDDRGATWRVQISPGERIIAGSAPSERVAWLVGENGLVLRTTDGERWERTTAPAATHLRDIDALDRFDATVSTADGRRFRTVDGGAQWAPLP